MVSKEKITIAGRHIGRGYKPFIVAEMSGNHNQSLDRALSIVDAAVSAGAHAIKLQTASPDGLTLDVDSDEFKILDKESLWFGQSLYQLYQKSVTPWGWHPKIFEHCRKLGIVVFSSPFELKAVDFLEEHDVPCYKIASFELVDTKLVQRVAQTGKPLILSTGMATLSEIETAVNIAYAEGNDQIILLKCTSTYPARPINTNLQTIEHLRGAFNTQVGLSDHTAGIGVACAAVAMGATFIEKHFTLSRADGGVDAEFSLEPTELRLLVDESERSWEAIGSVRYGGSSDEKVSVKFRRSIYISEDVKVGEQLNTTNLKIIRPGYGLEPKYYDLLIGRRANRDLSKGTAMSWEYI